MPSRWGTATFAALVAACCTVFAGIDAAAGSSAAVEGFEPRSHKYEFLQPRFKWPGNPAVITYHNKIDSRDDAIRRGIRAWNRSGIDIDFRRRRASRADVIISADRDLGCGSGYVPSFLIDQNGHPVSPKVKIGTGPTLAMNTAHECQYLDTLVAAHELGHVLGLDHEDDRCALMNTTLLADHVTDGEPGGVAPSQCAPSGPDRWYCRILARDDLRGAKKRYGGDFEVRDPAYCPV